MLTNIIDPRKVSRYPDWLARSIVSGFAATVVMTAVILLGYVLALGFAAITPPATASGQEMGRWFRGLTSNHLVDITQNWLYAALAFHLVMGLAWAGIYGYVFQPRLTGPSWERGMLFSLLPWVLSLTVFFPVVGAGFLGIGLGAGPLPMFGNLIAHLAYGLTLGVVYGPLGDTILSESPVPGDSSVQVRTEGMEARGIILGVLIGVLVGMAVVAIASPSLATGLSPLALVVATAAVGGAMGELVGSWIGIPARS